MYKKSSELKIVIQRDERAIPQSAVNEFSVLLMDPGKRRYRVHYSLTYVISRLNKHVHCSRIQ